MRTQEEIVKRIGDRESDDVLGFERTDYIQFLDFEHAKPFLKEGVSEDTWNESVKSNKHPREMMVDYMRFAFGKAHDGRGISASRSISHMRAWGWLDGDDLGKEIDSIAESHYAPYGLPVLRRICELIGIDPKEHGDYESLEGDD